MRVIGMETRLDDQCRSHAWRVVVADLRDPSRRTQYVGALPTAARYLSPPVDPVFGDLRKLGTPIVEQTQAIAAEIRADGGEAATMVRHHVGGVLACALEWRGIRIHGLEIPSAHASETDDPYAIGGWAGHEIAALIKLMENRK